MSDLAIIQKPSIDLITLELERDPRIKSYHSQRSYKSDLAAFEAWRSGRPMAKLLVEQYAAELQADGKAPKSINRHLAAIRWWARRLGDIAQDNPELDPDQVETFIKQSARVASVEDVKGERPQRGRHLSSGELAALMQTCEIDLAPAGRRDAAMIALAWATGIRRDELANLELSDLTPSGESEGDLVIRGKGDRTRPMYIYNGAYVALADWLAIRGNDPGAMFCVINKAGKITNRRLTGEAMRQILEKRIRAAGITPMTWHDFRRTFAGNLLDNGQDLVTVQKLMGHSDPTTTSNYDRRGDEVKRRAVKTLFVPYHGQ